MIFVLHLSPVVFWNAKHWIAKLGGQCFMHHWPSTQIFSFNSRPLQDTKGRKALELEASCYMLTSSTILGAIVKTIHEKIHIVKTMKIIVYIRRTINVSLSRPKNLLPFKVWNVIWEGRFRCVICHNNR